MIDRYEQNKARQGQLRSIEIAPQPEPEKKTLETAAAEEKDPKAKPDKEDKAEAKDETEEKLEEKPVKEPKEKAKN